MEDADESADPDDEVDAGADVDDGGTGLPPVPENPDDAVAADDHALPLEDLRYPTFSFDDGSVAPDGAFELGRDVDRETARRWLTELAGGLRSHDVAVEAPDRRVTLGVAPEDVSMRFDPGDGPGDADGTDGTDGTGVGELSVTVRLRAKAMTVADADAPEVGARGGRGFVPLAMLTGDRPPDQFRCYNWVDGPDEE